MKTVEVASALFFAAVGAGTCAMAYRLGLGSVSHPGPGFFALIIAGLLCLMSFALFFKECLGRKKEPSHGKEVQKTFLGRPLITLAVLVAYGFFFTHIGFALSTFALMMVLVWGLGRQKIVTAMILSAATVGVVYALFFATLGLPLPTGSFFSSLGG